MTDPTPLPTPARRWPAAAIALGALAVAAMVVLWRFDPAEAKLPLCGLHAATGLHCPGCGATRAVHALLRGRLVDALHQNALLVSCLPVAAYAVLSEWRRHLWGRPLPGDLGRRPAFYLAIAAAAVVFFVLRNLPWYPLTLLAPPA